MNTRDSVMSDRQMAVFLVNWCKFRGCGLTFATLGELIQHIEEIHINNDPRALERQESQHPPSLPLSYILRVFTDAARKEKKFRPSSVSPVPSFESNTPTGSEFDEDEVRSEDEDSDDSWTTQEEFTSELILSMISGKDRDGEKPYACPVPGCKKRYKNVNGIKYHAKHGHKKEIRVRKMLRCHCGKSYKSIPGLRSHCTVHHPATDFLTILQRVKSPFHKQGAGVQHMLIAPLQLASVTHKSETQLATDSENLSLSSMRGQALDPASLVSVPTAQTAVLLNQQDGASL